MNKFRSTIVLITLLLFGIACQTKPEITSILSPTATIMPDRTRSVVVVPTAKPTMASTLTPTPKPALVWQILFAGASCAELQGDCTAAYMGMPTYYYSVNSDGTEVRQTEATENEGVPPLPPLPQDAPLPYGRPQPSLDRSLFVYYTNDVPSGLYLVNVASGEVHLLISSKAIPGSPGYFYPACLTSDGSAVRFSVRFQAGQQRRDAFYSIDTNGQNLKMLFVLTDLGDPSLDWAMQAGTCSPDGQELAFRIYPDPEGGLYVLNLDSGQWRQVLAGYSVYRLTTKGFVTNSKP